MMRLLNSKDDQNFRQQVSVQSDNNMDDDSDDTVVEARVRQWLDQVIIGLNLCPFAERTVRGVNRQNDNQPLLQIQILRGNSDDDDEAIVEGVGSALLARRDAPGTTVVVCPDCHAHDFPAYLQVLARLESEWIQGRELEGLLQIAPFHPRFQFAGSSENEDDGADNWAGKAPYPIFHILREDEVSHAVATIDGDASRVWKRNVYLLETLAQQLPAGALHRLYFGAPLPPAERDSLQSLLRHFKATWAASHENPLNYPKQQLGHDEEEEID